MSREQNNWRPSISIAHLKQRAEIIKKIRAFFYKRHVLEVETPLMGKYSITDPFIQPITTNFNSQTYYLQTSPEYFMKRLLVAGSGDIFQIDKCFRNDEIGRLHNPEFTMLEWYRLGFDHQQLMDEMQELLQLVLGEYPIQRITYQNIFQQFLNLDPLTATIEELKLAARDLDCPDLGDDHTAWLQILFTEKIERQLNGIVFIYNFPAAQAALAVLDEHDSRVAHRFEVYVDGIELANGFHELTDVTEQIKRFENDNHIRQQYNLSTHDIDPNFIAALDHGLPECSGVALGVDRLIMLALKKSCLADVSFII